MNDYRFSPTSFHTPSVQASLRYIESMRERPYNYAFEPPAGTPWENYRHDARAVAIRDGRHLTTRVSIHEEGFELWDAPSTVRDFSDKAAIEQSYYPEVEELARLATGATRAVVFDHLVRQREADHRPLGFGRAGKGTRAAANGQVHNDYTEESGRTRLALVLGENAENMLGMRYSIINVWRSIKTPVLDTPLAVCDARTVDAADLIKAEVRYPKRNGEIYLSTYSPRHRWSYFSAMNRDEALVFKQYDSLVSGVARYTPHAAFDHPDVPEGTPPRESIEARCLVIYE
jgi:hypothetical protein